MLYELNQVVMAETGIDLFEDNRTFKQKLSDAWSQDSLVDSVVDCLSLVGSQANQNSKEAREIIEVQLLESLKNGALPIGLLNISLITVREMKI